MTKNLLQSRWVTIGLILAIGFLLLALIRIQPALVSVRRGIKNIDQKIAELERAGEEAKRLGDYLNSPANLERQARIKLNYKKPGENVVYIYTTEAGTTETQNKSEIRKKLENKFVINLKSWWGYLVDR